MISLESAIEAREAPEREKMTDDIEAPDTREYRLNVRRVLVTGPVQMRQNITIVSHGDPDASLLRDLHPPGFRERENPESIQPG